MALFSRLPFDKSKIETAIVQLESQSSAELRVYIERHKGKNVPLFDRALQVFQQLEMEKTVARNGVLIYIAFSDHQCAVIGDLGIHQFVGDTFWQQQCQLMIQHFKQKQYSDGVCAAIEQIGQELARYFPLQPDDVNELPNEVIIHD